MKVINRLASACRLLFKAGLSLSLLVGSASSGIAQIVSDGTLSTTVNSPDDSNFTITGGSQSSTNLYHSFSQFSVPTDGAAVFNNKLDVQNIFGRVTGGIVSDINGLIEAQGTANLFLFNPAGMIYGPNARLSIGGSFLGTTATSIEFAGEHEFNLDTQTTPLLTISTPVGLQFGLVQKGPFLGNTRSTK